MRTTIDRESPNRSRRSPRWPAIWRASSKQLDYSVRRRRCASGSDWSVGRRRRPATNATFEQARVVLGSDEFDRLWAEGGALPPGDAVAYAGRARGERRRPSFGWESLTPTEQRVVVLVVEGLTNPQIGDRLFMARWHGEDPPWPHIRQARRDHSRRTGRGRRTSRRVGLIEPRLDAEPTQRLGRGPSLRVGRHYESALTTSRPSLRIAPHQSSPTQRKDVSVIYEVPKPSLDLRAPRRILTAMCVVVAAPLLVGVTWPSPRP